MKADPAQVNRLLKTARGQIDGILKMVEEDRYCLDISSQIMAAQSILKRPTGWSCGPIWTTASVTPWPPATRAPSWRSWPPCWISWLNEKTARREVLASQRAVLF